MMVCDVDGVPLALTNAQRWVHTDILPDGTPDHEPTPKTKEEYREARRIKSSQAEVDVAMGWARTIAERMADPAMAGVTWGTDAKVMVTLMGEVERLRERPA